ncbi:MAG: hypothetical protein JXR53_14240 [Bacteroidales bacterium]|nr:hypothetical protein [Bacteroidales bacterium]
MWKYLKSINPLITGIFFLIWSMNAFFLFGNIGRQVSLFVGFLFILFAAYLAPKKDGSTSFLCKSTALFLVFILIAVIRNHQTLEVINVIFGVVCLGLVNAGYIIGKNIQIFDRFSGKVIYVYLILTLLGALAIFKYQSDLGIASRKLELEESINAIGLAYTNGLLCLFFIYLFQHSSVKYTYVKILILIVLSMLIGVIISTQSKGALIFLSTVGLLFGLSGIQFNKLFLKRILGFIPVILFLIIVFLFLQHRFPIMTEKIDGAISRFENLINYTANDEIDASALERTKMYDSFFDNFHTVIFWGQENYKPYPHNQFLEIIMRWGLLGLPFLFFSLYSLIRSLKVIKRKEYKISPLLKLLIPLFLFSYLQSMTSLSLEMNRMMWLGFGFICSYSLKYSLNFDRNAILKLTRVKKQVV